MHYPTTHTVSHIAPGKLDIMLEPLTMRPGTFYYLSQLQHQLHRADISVYVDTIVTPTPTTADLEITLHSEYNNASLKLNVRYYNDMSHYIDTYVIDSQYFTAAQRKRNQEFTEEFMVNIADNPVYYAELSAIIADQLKI